MSGIDPITTTSLLQEADDILNKHHQQWLYQAIVSGLQEMGYHAHEFMMAGDIIDYLNLHKIQPIDPNDALPVFVAIHGEREIARMFNERNSWGNNASK